MSDTMPRHAISLQQPWAYAVLHLGKNIENRKWSTKFRGPIVIHASKKIDREAEVWLFRNGYQFPSEKYPTGGYVGEVTIMDCFRKDDEELEEHPNPWAFGPYCWTLKHPVAYEALIPAKGRLGIYDREKLW